MNMDCWTCCVISGLLYITTGDFIHSLHITVSQCPKKNLSVYLDVKTSGPVPYDTIMLLVYVTVKTTIQIQTVHLQHALCNICLCHKGRDNSVVFPGSGSQTFNVSFVRLKNKQNKFSSVRMWQI